MGEAVKAFALLVDKNFLAVDGQLYALSKSPALLKNDLPAFAAHAAGVVPSPRRVVVLSTVDGQQLLNTRAPPGTALPRSNPSLLKLRAADPNKSVVSDLFVGAVAKRKDVAVDVPVYVDGAIRYRLSMGFEASELQTLIEEQNFPAEWIATIVDRNGVIVARNDHPERFIGERATAGMLRRILAGERFGVNYGVSLDGRAVAAFFFRAPASGWTAVLSIPQSEIRAPALYAAGFLALILCILLSVAVGMAGYLARKTAAPIERLRSSAELLGQGTVVHLQPTGLTEVDEVGRALSSASALVRRHQEQLEQRVAEAVAASETAQRAMLQGQKLEALGRLTGGVSHDFNNILQTLSSCLQLVRLTDDAQRRAALVETGEKAIRRATELTAQMRSFARVQDMRLETLDVADALRTIFPLLSSSLPDNIVLGTDFAEQLWPVMVDRLQFELGLLNIVINARDATPGSGAIVVATRNVTLSPAEKGIGPGDFVVISVSDEGEGMPEDVLAKAVDPFFTTKPVNQGSGLGLPQAYGFATQSKGTLYLESSVGHGTTVSIYLPRAASMPARPAGELIREELDTARRGVVLLVEDDELVCETVCAALEYAGFQVISAASGDEAVSVIRSGARVDAVFSDVVMPGRVNGVELARIIHREAPGLRVLLASGHTDFAVDVDNVELVGKPYDLAAVMGLLDAKRPVATDQR